VCGPDGRRARLAAVLVLPAGGALCAWPTA